MSKLSMEELREVKVEKKEKERRHTHTAVSPPYDQEKKGIATVSRKSNDFVYINQAYVGSLNSVNEPRPRVSELPVTEVYKEQYWQCSRWSFTARILSVAAGLVLGLAIGFAATWLIKGKDSDDGLIGGIFRSATVPD